MRLIDQEGKDDSITSICESIATKELEKRGESLAFVSIITSATACSCSGFIDSKTSFENAYSCH